MVGVLSRVNSKNIFLIDGIGALLSGVALGIILPCANNWIGMPVYILYFLAAVAVGFSIFSFGHFFLERLRTPHALRALAYSNLTYCALTLFLMITNFRGLKPLGIAYFVGEIVIILFIVNLEFLIATTKIVR